MRKKKKRRSGTALEEVRKSWLHGGEKKPDEKGYQYRKGEKKNCKSGSFSEGGKNSKEKSLFLYGREGKGCLDWGKGKKRNSGE